MADRLGIDPFGLAGWSGGGAHAAAATAVLGPRISRLSLIASNAPDIATRAIPNRPGIIRLFEWLSQRTSLHLRITTWMIRLLLSLFGQGMFQTLPSALFCAEDRALLRDPTFGGLLTASWREGLKRGSRGAAEDVALLLRPWDLLPVDGSYPVDIWCGSDDQLSPPAYGEWLAKQWKQATLHVLPGCGHLHIGAYADAIIAPHSRKVLAAK